jgi:hypothetical protein
MSPTGAAGPAAAQAAADFGRGVCPIRTAREHDNSLTLIIADAPASASNAMLLEIGVASF